MLPVVFVSHGAPSFALEPGVAGPALTTFGNTLPKPETIIVLSPHWQSQGLWISSTETPETIYDFSGFPSALYQLQYPVAGKPDIAAKLQQHLQQQGFSVGLNPQRGLDHGAWVPLRYMFPNSDVPVIQLSLPVRWSSRQIYQLGQALSDFAPYQVLFIGSGSLTHNLYEFSAYADKPAAAYAAEFSNWIANQLTNGETLQVVDALELAPHARRAHPTDEHFLPLSFVLGIAGNDSVVHSLVREIRHGVLSMDAYVFDRSGQEV
ncbi:MAG TPA: class III extradiol ring-cleavage dioxygenase [Psychromonas sp.]